MIITQILSMGKGKVQISFDEAVPIVLYDSELKGIELKEQMPVNEALYHQLFYEILGKRVIKRAMHLLEKRDRTEAQLRRKLLEGAYPDELIDRAVEYVKSYHYIDDERFARTYIRLNQVRKSSSRMKMDLLSRGVANDIIEQALVDENETDQELLIKKLLKKRHYDPDIATQADIQKNYQFLLHRGFKSSEIWHVFREYEA